MRHFKDEIDTINVEELVTSISTDDFAVKTNHSGDVLCQQQQVHNQSMQNQDQIQDFPETMQMWQEAIKEEQMKSILKKQSL
jgi:hypothetical protein